MVKKYDVIVIGKGISGLSSAHHLAAASEYTIAIIDQKSHLNSTHHAAGYALADFTDNFTRFSHSMGLEEASKLHRFAGLSFMDLQEFCRRNSIDYRVGHRSRYAASSEEVSEMEIAAHQLAGCQFESVFLAGSGFESPLERHRGLAKQVLSGGSMVVDTNGLIGALERQLPGVVQISGEVSAIAGSDEKTVFMKDGRSFRSEMVVLACHHSIPSLVPELADVVIPYVDQYACLEVESLPESTFVGDFTSIRHGHEWSFVMGPNTFVLGGARFLRPMAGIGKEEPDYKMDVEEYLISSFGDKFGLKPVEGSPIKRVSLVGVWPCDEVPLIGPASHDNRLLILTGYMGNGLVLGFGAGSAIKDLINSGLSPDLPSLVLPSRLRSGV